MTETPSAPDPIRAMRTFLWGHLAWLFLTSLGLVVFEAPNHLAGLWLAGGINLLSLYPSLRFLKNSPPADQATFQRLRAQLTLKVITVLATLGLLM